MLFNDFVGRDSYIQQFHFYGTKDKTIPPAVSQSFQANFDRPVIYPVEDNTHSCCWAAQWPELMTKTMLLSD